MKRNAFYFLIALALGGTGVVHAQDSATDATTPSFDGRWYVAPTVGGYYNNTERNTNSRQFYYGLGVGKFINSYTSLDLFFDRTKRSVDNAIGGGRWSNNNVGAAARFYYGDWNAWRPYALVGVLGSYHQNPGNHGWAPAAEVGAGVSKTITDSADFRVEAGYREDWDNKSQRGEAHYGDWFLGLSIVQRFGESAAAPAPAPVAPVAPDCSKQLRNGVNLCDNKCPDLPEGTIVGPDGCPQKVVIDLRGVNFKFDRPKKGEKDIKKTLAEPTADSLAILNQAVDTLTRYPQVKATVAGYTDSKGTPSYNQALSERRAAIVFNYLTSHGIDASRLVGPFGHGENDPIGDNATDAGRAQNRRTELQVKQ